MPSRESRSAPEGNPSQGFPIDDVTRLRLSSSTAQFMDEIDRRLNVFDRRPGQNAMPQVEDKAWTLPCLPEDRFHPALDFVQRREEHDGIQVALDRDIIAEPVPCFILRNTPGHPDEEAAGLVH